MTNILLVGATGMIGAAVTATSPMPLTVIARRAPADGAWPDSVDAVIAPAEDWVERVAVIAPAILVNCLGTTMAQAGSEAAFRAVDHDLVLAVAGASKVAGARHMISVSSVGARADSGNFYLKTKGEVEQALTGLGFARLDIIRPGLLMGDRLGARRPGESLGMALAPLTDALLHGSLRRYRSIPAAIVARAIIALAQSGGEGVHFHEHDAIRAFAD